MSDVVGEVVEQLRKKRAELINAIEAAQADVASIDQALDALGRVGEQPTRVMAVDSAPAVDSATANVMPSRRRRRRSGVSVKAKVLNLMEEGPTVWSGAEVMDEFIRRGDPIHAGPEADPSSNIRNAILNLRNEGAVVALDRGRYVAAKFENELRQQVELERLDAEENPSPLVPWATP